MLGTLITSKTRIKLLLKFFLNAKNTGYLKNLEQEFEDSSNGIRLELNKFEEAGLLTSSSKGNKKIFQANTSHPLFKDIHSIILKYTGIDQILESVINRLGNVNQVYLVGSLARGINSNIIDIIIIGDIHKEYLISLIDKAEPIIEKKIRYILYSAEEFKNNKLDILSESYFLIWNK
jgi:predicted nucleotidyltransferase